MQYSVSPRRDLQTSFGPKPERERQHADADAPGRQKVSELVHEDQHAEHEQKRQDGRSRQDLRLSILTRAPSRRAYSRAHRSTRRTTSSVAAVCDSMCIHRRSMTRGNGRKAERPVEKRSTATSLAAFRTTGRVPPASQRAIRKIQTRETVAVRRVKLQRARARRSSDGERALPSAPGYETGVLNRQAHVGDAQLRDHRAVDQLHHRVDDRLRVHHHVDLIGATRRTASAPRSPRGLCSSASPNRS